MAALLEAYITNLGKYAEGQLVGETLKFPTTAEEVQSLLKRIGVDGIRYEEIFISQQRPFCAYGVAHDPPHTKACGAVRVPHSDLYQRGRGGG